MICARRFPQQTSPQTRVEAPVCRHGGFDAANQDHLRLGVKCQCPRLLARTDHVDVSVLPRQDSMARSWPQDIAGHNLNASHPLTIRSDLRHSKL